MAFIFHYWLRYWRAIVNKWSKIELTMKLWTVHLGRHKAVKEAGIRFLDTTIQFGHHQFAPTWEMLRAFKAGELTDEEYSILYRRHMGESLFQYPNSWDKLLNADEVAIGCVCKAGGFCHRYLLAHFIERLCRERQIPFESMGEFGVNTEQGE